MKSFVILSLKKKLKFDDNFEKNKYCFVPASLTYSKMKRKLYKSLMYCINKQN